MIAARFHLISFSVCSNVNVERSTAKMTSENEQKWNKKPEVALT